MRRRILDQIWIRAEGVRGRMSQPALSRGAGAMLNFLRFRGGKSGQCWWKQANIASEIGCSRSSVIRWLAELRAAGKVEVERRGSTSNLYTVEAVRGTSIVPNCNNASIELKLEPEKKQAVLARSNRSEGLKPFPQLEDVVPLRIENCFGRLDINPEYRRIERLLLAADDRIVRALNPAAYRWAIIERESAGWRAWQEQQAFTSEAQDVRGNLHPVIPNTGRRSETCASLAEETGVSRGLVPAGGNDRAPRISLMVPVGIPAPVSLPKKPPDTEHAGGTEFAAMIADLARRKSIRA